METGRASSSHPWQPGGCQEDELWRKGQPLHPFLGKGEPQTALPHPDWRDWPQLWGFQKGRSTRSCCPPHPPPGSLIVKPPPQGESPLHPGCPRATTSPSLRLWPSTSWTSHLPAGNWESKGTNNARWERRLTCAGALVPTSSSYLKKGGGRGPFPMRVMGMMVGTVVAGQHPILDLTRASLFPASRERPLCWRRALCPRSPCLPPPARLGRGDPSQSRRESQPS